MPVWYRTHDFVYLLGLYTRVSYLYGYVFKIYTPLYIFGKKWKIVTRKLAKFMNSLDNDYFTSIQDE